MAVLRIAAATLLGAAWTSAYVGVTSQRVSASATPLSKMAIHSIEPSTLVLSLMGAIGLASLFIVVIVGVYAKCIICDSRPALGLLRPEYAGRCTSKAGPPTEVSTRTRSLMDQGATSVLESSNVVGPKDRDDLRRRRNHESGACQRGGVRAARGDKSEQQDSDKARLDRVINRKKAWDRQVPASRPHRSSSGSSERAQKGRKSDSHSQIKAAEVDYEDSAEIRWLMRMAEKSWAPRGWQSDEDGWTSDEGSASSSGENFFRERTTGGTSGGEHRAERTGAPQQLTAPALSGSPRTTTYKPHITPVQASYRDQCQALLTELGTQVTLDNSIKPGTDTINLKRVISALRELLTGIKLNFTDDRRGFITTMILCCNVVVSMDGLSMLKSACNSAEVEPDAQHIIETVVPHIWAL